MHKLSAATDTSSRPGRASGAERLRAAFAEIPTVTKALEAGTSAIIALTVSRLLVPEQLPFLRGGAFVIAGLGILTSWIGRQTMRRQAGKIIAAAVVCLLVLLVMDVLYVREVRYGAPVSSHQLLIGTHLSVYGDSTSRQVGSSPVNLIREAGKVQIPELWDNYYVVAIVYVLVFALFAFFGAVAIAAVVERFALRRR